MRAATLLLELSELPGARVRLAIDVRGDGAEAWRVLTRLCPQLSRLLAESFSGLLVHSALACPGCVCRGEWMSPTLWSLSPLLQRAEVEGARLRGYCQACGGDVPLARPPVVEPVAA